jgi:hypothetical protein
MRSFISSKLTIESSIPSSELGALAFGAALWFSTIALLAGGDVWAVGLLHPANANQQQAVPIRRMGLSGIKIYPYGTNSDIQGQLVLVEFIGPSLARSKRNLPEPGSAL